jgi:HK97 family phage portal protein
MKIFGFQVGRTKAAVQPMSYANTNGAFGWFNAVRESFAGSFQAHITVDAQRDLLSFGPLYAPISLIAGDVSKLCADLKKRSAAGIWELADTSPYAPVLRKPNHYQTRNQFWEHWMLSKLLHGNTYALKERDARGIVTALYILDPQRVQAMVTPVGDVYYQLSIDQLSGLPAQIVVAARDIIHDRMNCLWHPLVGISPIYAAGLSATQGRKIQKNSASFFANMSRPGGMLTAPNEISTETAIRLKTEFEANFGGTNLGRLFVGGDGLKFDPMAVPAEAAQLIEQLEWTAKDIARALGVPYFMVGGPAPATNTTEQETQRYYSQCIQKHLEAAEACLDDGLALPAGFRTEFDVTGLVRMDGTAQAEFEGVLVQRGIKAPNEARAVFNLPPVKGGEKPYLQQQNFSLEALAKRDALENPFVIDRPTTNPTPSAGGPAATADPAEDPAKQAAAETAALIETLTKGLAHVD